MIKQSDFVKVMVNELYISSTGLSVDKNSISHTSGHCIDLAKQLAIDFMDWKMTQFLEEEDGAFFGQRGEVFANDSEELFNLYIKSQK